MNMNLFFDVIAWFVALAVTLFLAVMALEGIVLLAAGIIAAIGRARNRARHRRRERGQP